jgi:hypothetical protein
MRLLFFPFSGFSFLDTTVVKRLLLLLILPNYLISVCCSKNKPVKPDHGLPNSWSRYGIIFIMNANGTGKKQLTVGK